MSSPRVSFLMGAYNAETCVGESIESMLAQTLQDFEIVIVDDGSTDRTLEILREYEAKDERIRVITGKNRGLTRALNIGLLSCRGALIARLDADDRCVPNRLEKQVAFLDENPDVVLVSTGANLLGVDRKPYHHHRVPTSDEENRRMLWQRNPFFHTALMYRMEVIKKVGPYDCSFYRSQDYELIVRMMDEGLCAQIDEPLVDSYQGKDRISWKHGRGQALSCLRAKLKHRNGRVLCDAPPHLFWWQLRCFILPVGRFHALRVRLGMYSK